MTRRAIPNDALDDRLFFGGTAGSGKTYNAMSGVERLLDKKSRVVIPDPLGVWWGLRLMADGKTQSPYDVVILGGPHGDLPLTEHAGALIGETVAGMKESCILDLSQLGTKAAERRFMLAFLTALYKHATGEPLHVVFDEADMWSPQKLLDKEGDAAKLLGMMETVVRRGRVRGFIPWLISQRPAVISKDVLSQVDGLIAFKLTSSQDRDAIGNWVEGQADKQQWRDIWASLPTMERGQGVVWIPARGILETVQFPEKETFDSSRTPKRGEKAKRSAELKPLDLGAVRERLSTVEAEMKANDPKALRAENAKLRAEKSALEKQMAAAVTAKVVADPAALDNAEERGFDRAKKQLTAAAEREAQARIATALQDIASVLKTSTLAIDQAIKDATKQRPTLAEHMTFAPVPRQSPQVANRTAPHERAPAARSSPTANGHGSLTPSLQKVIDAIAWWRKIGVEPVARARAAVVAGYSPRASTFGVYVAELVKQGLVETAPGVVRLSEQGMALANVPTAATADELRGMARSLLEPQQAKVFDVIYQAYPNPLRRDAIAEQVGLSPTASTVGVYIAGVAAYGIIETAGRGEMRAADWLFP